VLPDGAVLEPGEDTGQPEQGQGQAMNIRPQPRLHTTVRMSQPTIVPANGVELCAQTFGDAESPAILLIAGAASSMDWWESEFCERLASEPRFVIRYDLRDTGQSVTYEPGAPQYTGPDLVDDAVGVLDALRIDCAHVVGVSMGGGIAQHVALDHADRVASLTLMSTSPGGSDLPPMSEQLKARFEEPQPEPDWSDRDAVVEYIVEDLRAYAGTLPFDEQAMRELAGRIFDRTVNIESTMKNHFLLESGGEPTRPRLPKVTAPTLVVHGTEDPLFPLDHGEALAATIPGARLLPVEDMGHEMPPRLVWDRVVPAILDHTGDTS
jgi:pimeloyl-ACP methyl ester carboxylesterase